MGYRPFSSIMPKFINGLRIVKMYCIREHTDGPLWRIDYRPSGSGLTQYGVDYRGPLEGAAFDKALKVLNDMIGSEIVTAEAVRSHPGAKGWGNG